MGIPVASDNRSRMYGCSVGCRRPACQRDRKMQAVGRLCYVARLQGVAFGDPCSQMVPDTPNGCGICGIWRGRWHVWGSDGIPKLDFGYPLMLLCFDGVRM